MEFFASRRLSCGVIILNASRELLLCHVTGQSHWDLPKGGLDIGESPLEAALRETREETGLRLDAERLIDLGRMEYRPRKDLHLFATVMPRLDVSSLRCTSHFAVGPSGRRLPEMDDYRWAGFGEVHGLCIPRMATVLTERLDLGGLLDSLHPAREPQLAL